MGILDTRNEILNKELSREPYKWALKHFKSGVANNWTVGEVAMQDDAEQWNVPGKLSEAEKTLVITNLKFFGICESLTMDNISIALMRHVQDGYVRMALVRQAYEEALHSQTFLTISESLNISIEDVYQDWEHIVEINNKIKFIQRLIGRIDKPGFDPSTIQGKRDLLRDCIGLYLILEGTFFFSNFAQLLSMRRMNKMRGLSKFIDYIYRDESVHIAIGTDLINTILDEYPELFEDGFGVEVQDLFEEAVKLEDAYVDISIQEGLFGLRRQDFKEYVRYTADRRLASIGLLPIFKAKNPFPWMSTEADLITESNFFESRSTSYSTGRVDLNDF